MIREETIRIIRLSEVFVIVPSEAVADDLLEFRTLVERCKGKVIPDPNVVR